MAPLPAPRPVLTEVVDARAGVVRASGVLTPSGADLLFGAVEVLQRQGHRRITLDLTGVRRTVDGALSGLEDMCAGSRAGVVVRRPLGRAS